MKYLGSEHLYNFFSQYPSVSFNQQHLLLSPFDVPQGIYYLKQGHVRLYLCSKEEVEFTVLIYKPGDIFPLRWVLEGIDNTYYIETMSAVTVFIAPQENFLNELNENILFSRSVMNQLSYDFGILIYRMQHLSFGNAYQRVASIILTAARKFGSPNKEFIEIPFPLGLNQLAISSGITVQSAARQVKKLITDNIISFDKQTIIVIKAEELQKIAYV